MGVQVHHGITVVPGSLTAILEKQPGRRRGDRLLVIVDVEAEANCPLDLVATAPQGINPLIKLLRIRSGAAPPPPGAAKVRRTLRYEEAPAADYQEVWLGEGDSAISAKVALVM